MSLNIKDPTAHALAQTLAKETGETMTQAVTEAIRERLERVRRQRKPEATVAELLAIGVNGQAQVYRSRKSVIGDSSAKLISKRVCMTPSSALNSRVR